MSAGAFVDVCKFNATSSGTVDFVVSSAVTGYQTPASAGAVNATVYSYRAESANLAEWEIGFGAYTVAGTTLARTTIVASSTGSKVSFTAAPQVGITALTADLQNASLLTSGTLPAARLPSSPITNSLGADVALNNTANYFDGPSVAQGVSGTWFASGTVNVNDTAGAALIFCKLWDGTTVIASTSTFVGSAGQRISISLSGFITSPAGNIRMSCRDSSSVSGSIAFNTSGNSKDSTITAFRIG